MSFWRWSKSGVVRVFWVFSVALLAAVAPGDARASDQVVQPAATEVRPADGPAPWTLELGPNFRSEFGIHFLRLDAAVATANWRAILSVDPLFFLDGKTSTDLLVMWRTDGFEPFVGWRLQTVEVLTGPQFQHNLVIGTALALPDFWEGRIGGQWGAEMAMTVYKHGGGVAASTIGFDSGRHYIDRVNFGMFVRFHYNLELGR